MGSDNRIAALDIAKGICILLVIAGHAFCLDWCFPIYAFHLPCFFFISGMLIKEERLRSPLDFIKHETKVILAPFFIMLAISVLVCIMVSDWRNLITTKGVLRDLYFVTPNFAQNSSLWYLVAFWFSIIYLDVAYSISKRSRSWFAIAISVVAVVSLCLPSIMTWLEIPAHRLPLRADSGLLAVVFVGAGFCYRDEMLRLIKKLARWHCVAGLVLVVAFASVLNGPSNMASLLYGRFAFLYLPIAFAGIVAALSLSSAIESCPRIQGVLGFFGKHSLIVFGFQSMLIRGYNLVILKTTGEELVLYGSNPIVHQILAFGIVSFIAAPLLVVAWLNIRRKIGYV